MQAPDLNWIKIVLWLTLWCQQISCSCLKNRYIGLWWNLGLPPLLIMLLPLGMNPPVCSPLIYCCILRLVLEYASCPWAVSNSFKHMTHFKYRIIPCKHITSSPSHYINSHLILNFSGWPAQWPKVNVLCKQDNDRKKQFAESCSCQKWAWG